MELVANGIRLTKRYNALSSRSDVTRGLPDLGKSFTIVHCTGTMPLTIYSKFSMFTLQIWVFKSGVLKDFIHSQ
jgi:sorbitol-specific phosphotransferase system component IIBC